MKYNSNDYKYWVTECSEVILKGYLQNNRMSF
jgi:hypothetical protein